MAAVQQPLEEQTIETRLNDIQNEADIDKRLTGLLMRDAEVQRQAEEKRVRNQIGARSLADLGGIFADMVRANEGAVVGPREIEKAYNNLSDQQRGIYDNYRARMDVLLKQKQARDAERAGNKLQYDKMKWQEEQAARARKHETDMLNLRINNGYGRPEDKYFLDFGNGDVMDYQNHTAEGQNAYAALFEYMVRNGVIPKSALTDKDDKIININDQRKVDTLVRMYWPKAMADEQWKTDMYKIVFGKEKNFITKEGSANKLVGKIQGSLNNIKSSNTVRNALGGYNERLAEEKRRQQQLERGVQQNDSTTVKTNSGTKAGSLYTVK